MNKLSILLAWAIILSFGCTKEKSVPQPATGSESTVEVNFRLGAVSVDASLEPMTRATAYKTWLRGNYRMLILKKIDRRWVVDTTCTVGYTNASPWNDVKITDKMPANAFHLEMRPGEYRVVAVINYSMTSWNNKLVPGTVVSDAENPSLLTPWLVTYSISTHWMNNGYRQLAREIFVATADFTVPKREDLHSTRMPDIALHAERRVGKLRLLLKSKPELEYDFQLTAHTIRIVLKSDRPFPQGIDALGEMYYGEENLFELPCCMSTMNYHLSGTDYYQMNQTNSTVFSPFILLDPKAEDIRFDIGNIRISGASGGYNYKTDAVFSRTLGASKTTGVVFEATGIVDNVSPEKLIEVVEATDADGNPENAAELFDPFYEWNAENN